MKRFSLFFLVSITLLTLNCSLGTTIRPVSEYGHLADFITDLKETKRISGTGEIDILSKDYKLSGPASLKIDNKTIDVRVYSFGFLSGRLFSKGDFVYTTPVTGEYERKIMVEIIKKSMRWWESGFSGVVKTEDEYLLSARDVVVTLRQDKDIFIPIDQKVQLPGGEKMFITYNYLSSPSGKQNLEKITCSVNKYFNTYLSVNFTFHKLKVE